MPSATLYERVGYLTPTEPILVTPSGATGAGFGSSLIIAPGSYGYGAGTYNLSREGVFAFTAFDATPPAGPAPFSDGGYRIVWGGANVRPLLAGLAALHGHGTKDESLTDAQRVSLMKTRRIATRCGAIVSTAQYLLGLYGFQSRIVRFLTGGALTNFDDGHIAIEVFAEGKWRFYDLDNDRVYLDAYGEVMSAIEVIDKGVANCPRTRLALSDFNAEDWSSTIANISEFVDLVLRTDAQHFAWTSRIFQCVGIDLGSHTDWYVPAAYAGQATYINSVAGWSTMAEATWRSTYYPGPYTTIGQINRKLARV